MKSKCRLLALVLALCLLTFTLASCGETDVPEGMQLASDESLDYALYVPINWTVNHTGNVSSAYVSQLDRSNVSVTIYMPQTAMTAEDYWKTCNDSYAASFDDYTLVSTGTTSMAGQTVPYYIYTLKMGEDSFEILQAILGASGLFYSFTYTAPQDSFDTYLEEVLHMIEVFTLK